MLEKLVELHDGGFLLTVTRPGSKAALLKDWPTIELTLEQVMRHVREGCGVAVKMGKTRGPPVCVLDRDGGPEEWRENVPQSPMTVTTPSGGEHWYFRLPEPTTTRIKFIPGYDFKATGYCLFAGEIDGKPYLPGRVVPPEELPLFPMEVLKREERPPLPPLDLPENKKLEAMRKWIRHKVAIEGQGGDKVTFAVAMKIASVVADFQEGMREFLAWDSTNAHPPWAVDEKGIKALEHKLRSAMSYLRR